MSSRLLRKIDDLEKDVSALRREAHDAMPEAVAKTLEAQRRERISWGARMGSWASVIIVERAGSTSRKGHLHG